MKTETLEEIREELARIADRNVRLLPGEDALRLAGTAILDSPEELEKHPGKESAPANKPEEIGLSL